MTGFRRHAGAGLYLTFGSALSALVLGVALSASPEVFAELYLTLSLNFLSVPVVLLTDRFVFPLWVWYVIGVHWAGALTVIERYSV